MSTLSLPVLKPPPVRQSVADAIRHALFEGRFAAGQDLSEVALASGMKVSRGPVREALLQLAEEGLVKHTQNQGFRVVDFTSTDVLQVLEVRLPLETLALTLARERVSTKDLKHLENLTERIIDGIMKKQTSDVIRADLEFHCTIAEKSGNPWLQSGIRRVLVPYFVFTWAFRLCGPDPTAELSARQHELAREHQMYVDYLSRQIPASADECVRFHLRMPAAPNPAT